MSEPGYVCGIAPCWSCHAIFAFDLERVPSIVVDGEREPVCRSCVARANALRRKNGRPLIVILPGAYPDEPGDELEES